MNKIEKIIDSGFISDEFVTFNRKELNLLIREYAEYYAQKLISQIKKSEIMIEHPNYGILSGILNGDFTLPKHE